MINRNNTFYQNTCNGEKNNALIRLNTSSLTLLRRMNQRFFVADERYDIFRIGLCVSLT